MFSLKSGNRMLGLLVLVTVLAVPAWAGKRGGSPPPPAPAKPEIAYLGNSNALWVMDSDGSNQTALYPIGKPPRGQVWHLGAPSWSPDGLHIAFPMSNTQTYSAMATDQVWIVDLDLTSGTPVAESPRCLFEDSPTYNHIVRWSSRGDFIGIARYPTVENADQFAEVWVIPTQPRTDCPNPLAQEGQALTMDDLNRGCGDLVLEGFVPNFTWSPDDSQLIYGGTSMLRPEDSPECSPLGCWALKSLDLETGVETEIPGTEITRDGYYCPLFPDLVRVGGIDKLTFSVLDLNSRIPWVIYGSIEIGEFKASAAFGGGNLPTWSPDGRYIAVQGTNGRILRLDAINDEYRNLNNLGGGPAWLRPYPPLP